MLVLPLSAGDTTAVELGDSSVLLATCVVPFLSSLQLKFSTVSVRVGAPGFGRLATETQHGRMNKCRKISHTAE